MNKELIEKCNVLARRVETPSSNWSADGKPDPHGKTYDCERAGLHMGNMTDDELANGAFLNYDQPLNVAGILAGTCHSPIAWMTAVKDRIRWLSRSLEKVAAERDALAAELKSLREQMPPADIDPHDAMLQKQHDEAQGPLANAAHKVYFRAGLLACREHMARFVESQDPSIAASIRANWWPDLGPDMGPPRRIEWGELTEGEYGESGFRVKEPHEISPTIEALPIAQHFLTPDEGTTK